MDIPLQQPYLFRHLFLHYWFAGSMLPVIYPFWCTQRSLAELVIFLSCSVLLNLKGFPGGSVVKNLLANSGDVGLIPGLRRSPGEGNGNPLQYSCLENLMNRGWWDAVCGVTRVR